jgi:hypothetical protein
MKTHIRICSQKTGRTCIHGACVIIEEASRRRHPVFKKLKKNINKIQGRVLIGEARKKEASVFEQYGSEYIPSLLQAVFFVCPVSSTARYFFPLLATGLQVKSGREEFSDYFFKKIFLNILKKYFGIFKPN